MNMTGRFDRGNGVHNVSLAKCSEGLNTCFLKAASPHPRALATIQHRDGGETTPNASILSISS